MTARSGQHAGAEWFTSPQQVNQRRYEALRAYFTEGLTYEQAGATFGYTRWAMINLVHEYRAGKLELFAPLRKPGPPPGAALAKERVRGRVIGLRRQGLSSYEISARLSAEALVLQRPPDAVGRLGERRLQPDALAVIHSCAPVRPDSANTAVS